jgi:predicted alpha/beta hydrolase family esterase
MFLILHGLSGSPEPHWQWWLSRQLEAQGKAVSFPAFPDQDHPSREGWVAFLSDHLDALGPLDTVVCHSLAVPTLLHTLAVRPGRVARRILLVAPPGWEALGQIQDEVRNFAPVPLDPGRLAGAAEETRLVFCRADPFCVEGADRLYARPLGIPADQLDPAHAHLNTASGFGPWPQVLQWCLGERSSITGQD